MPSTFQKNEFIKRQIVVPDNCHCTTRHILSDTTAEARCNKTGSIKARISWVHKKDKTKIRWFLPFGVSFLRVIGEPVTEEDVDRIITDGFVEMHQHWEGE